MAVGAVVGFILTRQTENHLVAFAAAGLAGPSQVLAATPFAPTIVVLAVISRNARRLRLHVPFSPGETFSKTESDL